MAIQLEQPVIDDGDRFVNFFEGRILTGRDLRDEQAAGRRRRLALGRAVGTGIAFGFEVTDATPASPGTGPTLRVSAGLAINREGEVLKLEDDKLVRLARATTPGDGAGEEIFGPCDVQPEGVGLPAQEGFYLITIAPASGYEQEAPKSGLGEAGVAGGCGRRYATLGVQFRLVQFDPATLGSWGGTEVADLVGATGPAQLSLLRNLVAHLGLGTTARSAFPADPFARVAGGASAFARYGLVDALSEGPEPALTRCEVPLATLYWRPEGLGFVDMWSVRRLPSPPPQELEWPLLASARRTSVDEATFFQFQRHIAWLLALLPEVGPARDYFRYLPPAGVLPLPSATPFIESEEAVLPLNRARLIPLLKEARAYGAVDLATSPAPGFVIYRVEGVEDYVVFVSDAVPSPERAARKCAALEERLKALEEALVAPGILHGQVRLRHVFGFTDLSQPVPGATVRATITEDETSSETETDQAGNYRLSLAPGTYVVMLPQFEQVQPVEVVVERGGETVQNFVVQFPFPGIPG